MATLCRVGGGLGRPRSSLIAALLALGAPATVLAASEHGMEHSSGQMADGDMSAADMEGGDHDGHEHGHGHGDEHEHTFSFGEPAAADDADRTIVVTANDTMRFDPGSIDVNPGETVHFVVRNEGRLEHSFTLGTAAEQMEHEEEMKGMSMDMMAGHMDDDPNGIVIAPGATGSLTWHFTKAVRSSSPAISRATTLPA